MTPTPILVTQKERVLELLQMRGSLCIKAITTTRCRIHDHGVAIARYTLIVPGQQEFPLA